MLPLRTPALGGRGQLTRQFFFILLLLGFGNFQDTIIAPCYISVYSTETVSFVVWSNNCFRESNDELLLLISSLQLWLVKVVLQLQLGLDHCVACVVELLDLQKPLVKNLVKACKSFLE